MAVALLLALSGCQGSDSDPSPSPSNQQARSVPSLSAYCDIQVLRRMIADGDVKRSALPDTADLTEVDGTPGLAKVQINDDERRARIDTTTDADIEKSQGGPGYLSTQGE